MKVNKILIVLLVSFILPMNVKAAYCTYTEQADLRKMASNVSYSYDYREDSSNVIFSITFTNLTNDLYIIDKNTGQRYDYNGTSEITIDGYGAGTNNQFLIYATDSNCYDQILSVKYINLPSYNKYYKDNACKGIESYSICYKWQANNLSYEEFIKKANEYKKEVQQEEQKQQEENTSTLFDSVFEFIIKYYLYIIIGIVIIVVPLSFLINKKNNNFD